MRLDNWVNFSLFLIWINWCVNFLLIVIIICYFLGQQGIPVKRVNALVDDIAMTLRARGDIRMEIPVPGKNAFGVEIPNEEICEFNTLRID